MKPALIAVSVFYVAWWICLLMYRAPTEHKDYSITCPVDAAGELLGALTCVPEAVLPA